MLAAKDCCLESGRITGRSASCSETGALSRQGKLGQVSALWCSSRSLGQCVPTCCLLPWTSQPGWVWDRGKLFRKGRVRLRRMWVEGDFEILLKDLGRRKTRRLRVSLHCCWSYPGRKIGTQLGKQFFLCQTSFVKAGLQCHSQAPLLIF